MKTAYPVSDVRRYLEPGPVVLISSRWREKNNLMTLGWHTILEFSPSLVGCVISAANHSFAMIVQSGECVINLPEQKMAQTVSRIGNCSGSEIDKFHAFGLTPEASERVAAPSVAECYASFECRLYDDTLVSRYNFFIFEVVSARVCNTPAYPQTLHYLGGGQFRGDGKMHDLSRWFTKVS